MTFVVTVYGEILVNPIAHTKQAGDLKPHKTHVLLGLGFMRLGALLRLLNPRIDKNRSVMFGFTGIF